MGDSMDCCLQIYTKLPEDLLDSLTALLDDTLVIEEESTNLWYFSEVNWGILPDEVIDWLVGHQVPFAWTWGSGANYGQGVTLYSGEDEPSSWGRDGTFLMLNLEQAADPQQLAQALALQEWWNNAG